MIEWLILIVAVIFAIVIVNFYNSVITLKNRIENAWSQIDVQTKRRYDLIPNLVETVKGYATHEKSVFVDITKARTAAMQAKTIEGKAKAENVLTGALKSLFAVAENYPTLRASENFMQLQEELSGTESKIAYSRQFYNDSVLEFNQRIQMFPNNIMAGIFAFKEKPYFEIEEEARKAVKVKF